jgi:hypothetical protein
MGVSWGQVIILNCDWHALPPSYIPLGRLGISLEEVGIPGGEGER